MLCTFLIITSALILIPTLSCSKLSRHYFFLPYFSKVALFLLSINIWMSLFRGCLFLLKTLSFFLKRKKKKNKNTYYRFHSSSTILLVFLIRTASVLTWLIHNNIKLMVLYFLKWLFSKKSVCLYHNHNDRCNIQRKREITKFNLLLQ